MLRLDYDKGNIAITGDVDAFYIRHHKLPWLMDHTHLLLVLWSNMDELSDIIQADGEEVDMSKRFVDFAKFYRENYFERNDDGDKPMVVIHSGVNYSKILGVKYPKDKIDKATKYFFKPAKRMKKFTEGNWDGYIHLLNRGSFPTGLVTLVTGILHKEGYKYKVVYKYNRRPDVEFKWTVDDGITPDPDQIEAIRMAWEAGRSVVKAPTGFGKTAILAKRLTAKFGVRTLFLANKKALLDDAKEEFLNGVVGLEEKDIGEIKDGTFGTVKIKSDTPKDAIPKLDQPIIVATIQSLDAKLKDPRTRDNLLAWLKGVEFLMVDETQAVGTKTWDEVLDCVYAPYRVFLSATPKRTDGATLKIFARAGDLSFFTTAETQIAKGRLSEVEIEYRVYDHMLYNQSDVSLEYMDCYRNYIVENDHRNAEFVIKPAMEMLNEGRYVLILFQWIDHGIRIRDMLLDHGLKEEEVRLINGSTKNEARKNAIKEFRKGDFRVLVGSTIFDAGVNIPIISGIVMAGAGNSEITLVQRIGRSVRNADYEEILGYLPDHMKEADGKKVAKVIDVRDTNVKFFETQSRNRYNVAKGEFGSKRVSVVGKIVRPKPKNQTKADKASEAKLNAELEALGNQLAAFETKNDGMTEEDILNTNMNDILKAFDNM